jgi:hypothetical protein
VATNETNTDETNLQLVTLTQKYLGNKEYVLSGTDTGYIGAEISPLAPYTNLTNRYYPTVATLPQISGNIVSRSSLGGYFVPNNLGITTYQTKNISSIIDTTKIVNGRTYLYIDPTRYNKGRGLTEKDQDNIIKHIENTDWMKGSFTDTAFDGQVKNSDLYQKFIPYQSNIESQKTDTNGIVTVKDDFEYWTGDQKNIWVQDNKYTELSWLKYFDIDVRTEYTLIAPNKELYSWHADVFGNQYGLYKPTLSARTIYAMQNSYGELWMRTADNSIYKGPDALSAVYLKYNNQPTIYNQLTANSIKNIEVFFDTLVIELSGYVLFEKITFDYTALTITNTDTDYLYLDLSSTLPTRILSSASLTAYSPSGNAVPYYGGIWYNEPEKKFVTCLLLSAELVSTSPSASGIVVPVLYEYNLNSPATRKRIWPTNSTNYDEYVYFKGAAPDDPNKEYLTYIEPPVITYNKSTNSYFITFIAYVDQTFKIINYSTGIVTFGNVVATETGNPIVTENNVTIQVV